MSGKLHQKNFIEGFGFQNTRVITVLKFAIVILLLSLPYPMHAQTPEWVYQYVHPDISDEWSTAIVVDSAGNTYTTGVLSSDDTTGGHITGICAIKLNTLGQEQWIYFNDTLGRLAYGNDIALNKNFNKVYVAGYSESFSPHNLDLIVVCIDTTGQGSWVYRDLNTAEATAISVSASNMIYVAGSTYDMVCIKLDSSGNEKWRYVYDGPAASYDEATDITVDSDESIYIGGYSTGNGTSTDFTVIKLDSAGNEKWVYRYNGPVNYRDEIETIALDIFGNIYMTGWSWGIDWDFCVVKIDSLGQEQWVYRYNGPANWADFSFDIAVDDTGNVYMAGRSMRQDTISLFCVVKLDSGGNEEWMYSTSGPLDEGGAAQHIVLDGLGNIYAAGFFYGIAVVKLTPVGDTLWTYIHPSGGTSDIVVDINENIYASGTIGMSQWDDDIIILKFFGPPGIEEVKGRNFIVANIGSILRGNVVLTLSQNDILHIYDVTGRKIISRFVKQKQRVSIKLQQGVYFIVIKTVNNIIKKKIVII